MTAQPSPTKGVSVWILDTGFCNHRVSSPSLSQRLRGAVEQNAHAVRLATANGIIETTGVIDVDIQSLGAKARVLMLPNTLAVLSIGRILEDHECTFKWISGEASITNFDGGVHMCVVRNCVSHLDGGRDHDSHQQSKGYFLCQALLAERQMTASSSTSPLTWRPTWRAIGSPASSSTMNSITFRSAQIAIRAHRRNQNEACTAARPRAARTSGCPGHWVTRSPRRT